MEQEKLNLDYYEGKNVLITGHRGYLGYALVKRLTTIHCNLFFFEGDISIVEAWKKNLNNNIDLIFHLAAIELLNEYQPVQCLKRDWEVNSLSVLHLADLCREYSNPRIIFSSSTNIFGSTKSEIIDEKEKSIPRGIWSAHKLLAENYLRIFRDLYGVKSLIIRLPNVYGPTEKTDVMFRMVLNRVIRKALATKKLVLYNNYECLRDFIFIDDAVNALLSAGMIDGYFFDGQFYIVGGGEVKTLKEIWGIISKSIDCVLLEIDNDVKILPIEKRSFIGNYSSFNALTGWKPNVSIEDGIQITIDEIKKLNE